MRQPSVILSSYYITYPSIIPKLIELFRLTIENRVHRNEKSEVENATSTRTEETISLSYPHFDKSLGYLVNTHEIYKNINTLCKVQYIDNTYKT